MKVSIGFYRGVRVEEHVPIRCLISHLLGAFFIVGLAIPDSADLMPWGKCSSIDEALIVLDRHFEHEIEEQKKQDT